MVTPGADDGSAESNTVAPDSAAGSVAGVAVTCAAGSGAEMGTTVSTRRAADVEGDTTGLVHSTSGAAAYTTDKTDTADSEEEIQDKLAKVSL